MMEIVVVGMVMVVEWSRVDCENKRSKRKE
jgi:hypothetical protein